MAVCNCNTSKFFYYLERFRCRIHQMVVNNGEFRMCHQKFSQVLFIFIFVVSEISWDSEDSPSKGQDFLFIGGFFRTVQKEVELNHGPVNVTVQVHDKGLCSSKVHCIADLKNSDWLHISMIKRFQRYMEYPFWQFATAWDVLFMINQSIRIKICSYICQWSR